MRKQFFESRRLFIDDNPFVLSGEMGKWHTVQTIIRRRGVCVCGGGGGGGGGGEGSWVQGVFSVQTGSMATSRKMSNIFQSLSFTRLDVKNNTARCTKIIK